MRILSFFLSLVLFVSAAHAYTLVLKSGRRCSGELIGQDDLTLQLRDPATGLILSYRRAQLDAPATAAANVRSSTPEPSPADGDPAEPVRVAELARRLREQRTGRSRVYTPDDLLRAPAISVSGATESSETPPVVADANPGEERRWREEARRLRKELEAAQDRYAAVMPACEKARQHRDEEKLNPHRHPLELAPLMQEPSECRRLAELQQRVEHAQSAIEDFEDRARRSGVPWRWLQD